MGSAAVRIRHIVERKGVLVLIKKEEVMIQDMTGSCCQCRMVWRHMTRRKDGEIRRGEIKAETN